MGGVVWMSIGDWLWFGESCLILEAVIEVMCQLKYYPICNDYCKGLDRGDING